MGPSKLLSSLAVVTEICYFFSMHVRDHKWIRVFLYGLALFVAVSWSSLCLATTEILKVRTWAAPDHTRVVFDLDDEVNYQFQIKDNILTLEFADTTLHPSLPDEKKIGKPGISRIIFTSAGDRFCKIEIILDRYLKADVFKLKKFMDKPDRVVVDVVVGQAVKEEVAKEPVSLPPSRKRIIVLDPGHGGDDPGAIGKNGTYEKHVVLAISREIKKAIDKMPGYRAILTRDGDYYVSFNRRLQIAREVNASLFISVHADAARNRQARGSSVYCLSNGGASNEVAKLLANNENLSDVIGGVPNSEGNNQSDQIILNMFQTNTINLSKTYAMDLLDQIGRVHDLKYPIFHEAPFRVLKLLDIPAVLLETAYLSNPQEERMLRKSSFHKTIAQAVASSVGNYFSLPAIAESGDAGKIPDDPAPIVKKPEETRHTVKTATYRIKRGDTLNSIAREHSTTLAVLLKLNSLAISDPLYAGRKILVPVAEAASAKPLKSYVIKKGDTLFSLAKSNFITVDELRRLNKMDDSDALLLGRKIKIPVPE
jgi:N-acetylmuramoyl-L-alanine amidase